VTDSEAEQKRLIAEREMAKLNKQGIGKNKGNGSTKKKKKKKKGKKGKKGSKKDEL
jgi:hypothetical protein